ncbi:IclR family transcriptional regulator [Natronococcus occultus]|uniref:Transcriptional regulator n=1 Tax=Natronococcus occultus SP4 TaxID=694430 RepID=L0K1P6_9EURY|nr:IclR family transcriptional regulator [Natronococcus occultus]AGB38906.1 transcriptional regulator [Natronococcus occultus SP4]
MTGDNTGQRTVKTAETVVDIIETLSELERASLTELAAALDMPRSTLHVHLSTLVEQELLVKEENEYRLGMTFLCHGTKVQKRNALYQKSGEFLRQVARQTEEIVWLVVEEYGEGVCLRKEKGELAVQPYKQIGKRITLHDTAAGKSILSQFTEPQIREIAEKNGLQDRTPNTITDLDELLEEIETVRERNVAFNDEESIEGFRAVASPVSAPDGQVGAIVVSGPKNRLRGEQFSETIPEIVSGAANALELELSSNSG